MNDEFEIDSYPGDGGPDRQQGKPPRRRNNQPKQHFEVSDKVHIKLDFDFALALGQFLLDAEIDDKRFKSLGHHLCNLEGE